MFVKKPILLVLISLSLTVCSCGQSESAKDAAPKIERVSQDRFKDIIENNQDIQIIDVRTAAEFNGGAIASAVNIDYLDDNFEAKIKALDKNKVTLIYCQAGGRSAKALQLFKKAGFKRTVELQGGYSGWE